MTLGVQAIDALTAGPAPDVWQYIAREALTICSGALTEDKATKSITERDREIGKLDHFLASSGWELWSEFGTSVERTSERLVKWWAGAYDAKAILILDGLSLRELPWLLQGAQAHGLKVAAVATSASELPPETNEFASALGYPNRSQLQNNGGKSQRLPGARTECVALPFADCANLIDATPNWVFWHQWPDAAIHDAAGAGQGLDQIVRDTMERLTSEDFWSFVKRLAQGRSLVITSDHGYAATGLFHDAADEQAQFLKDTFRSGRSRAGKSAAELDRGPFVPPVALPLESPHGAHLLALGRRKWKSQGGYPTLAHGGLSLLEVLCPFVEISAGA